MSNKYTLVVDLTDDFRLASGDKQFIVLERKMVDPTRAPKFDPTSMSSDLREEWEEIGYYGLHPIGIAAAIDYVSMRSVSGEMTLGEFAESIRQLREEIRRVIPVKLS